MVYQIHCFRCDRKIVGECYNKSGQILCHSCEAGRLLKRIANTDRICAQAREIENIQGWIKIYGKIN